jgi:hypothetical protein
MLVDVQIWADTAALDEAARYTGALTALQACSPDGRTLSVKVLEADPMVTISWALAEEFFGPRKPMRLLDTLRIDAVDGPVIYIVRGIDTERGVYYLSWPD